MRQSWKTISAEEYARMVATFGASFTVQPRVVSLIARLANESVSYFGCEANGQLVAAAPVLRDSVVPTYTTLDLIGLGYLIDVGHGELVLPVASGAGVNLPFQADFISPLHVDDIVNLKEGAFGLMLGRSHGGLQPRLSRRVKANALRSLRRYREAGGVWRAIYELSPQEIGSAYVELFTRRWGAPPQGHENLLPVLAELHDLLWGVVLFHKERIVAIQIDYAVETPRGVLGVGVGTAMDPDCRQLGPGSLLMFLNQEALESQGQRCGKSVRFGIGKNDLAYKFQWGYKIPAYQTK